MDYLNALDLKQSLVTHLHHPKPHSLNILLTNISSDSHTWNLVFMQLLLEFMGHEVVNLGACCPDELIIERCGSEQFDLLVVSTVNGHGNIDGERLIRKLRARPDVHQLTAVIGGKLGIHGVADDSHSQRLLDAGFNAVFNAASSLLEFQNFVKTISARPALLSSLPWGLGVAV
ncbi:MULTISPECIES: cobalamin B12-binding domain-containing protein [unclassified Pseudomonas]|uniref:cobalamin B12-binding domain-containing protein n=1 Tax=unclassified Pseudomonas TaxID=196821 RepID=UPI0025CFAD17|nr:MULTISPECIES: methylmalonyl-CoA mutase [unclassified Pseudomonas]